MVRAVRARRLLLRNAINMRSTHNRDWSVNSLDRSQVMRLVPQLVRLIIDQPPELIDRLVEVPYLVGMNFDEERRPALQRSARPSSRSTSYPSTSTFIKSGANPSVSLSSSIVVISTAKPGSAQFPTGALLSCARKRTDPEPGPNARCTMRTFLISFNARFAQLPGCCQASARGHRPNLHFQPTATA